MSNIREIAAHERLPFQIPSLPTPEWTRNRVLQWIDTYPEPYIPALPEGLTLWQAASAITSGGKSHATQRLRRLSSVCPATAATFTTLFDGAVTPEMFGDGTGFRFRTSGLAAFEREGAYTILRRGFVPLHVAYRLTDAPPRPINRDDVSAVAGKLESDPDACGDGYPILPASEIIARYGDEDGLHIERLLSWAAFGQSDLRRVACDERLARAFLEANPQRALDAYAQRITDFSELTDLLETIVESADLKAGDLPADRLERMLTAAKQMSAPALEEYGTIQERCAWASSDGIWSTDTFLREPTGAERMRVAAEAFTVGLFDVCVEAYDVLPYLDERAAAKILTTVPGGPAFLAEYEHPELGAGGRSLHDVDVPHVPRILLQAANLAFTGPYRDELWLKILAGDRIALDRKLSLATFASRLVTRWEKAAARTQER